MKFASMFAALVLVLLASSAGAENAPTIYVGSFEPAETPSKSGFAPLHALTSGLHKRHEDANAKKLSASLVRALNARQPTAEPLPDEVAAPTSGWIVRGVFYSLDNNLI